MTKPKLKGLHTHRFKDNPLEKAFADAWSELNTIRPGTPKSVLAYLMDLTNRGEPDPPLTHRDYTIAATVIQWLGSLVGQGFLRDVLKQDAGGEWRLALVKERISERPPQVAKKNSRKVKRDDD